LSSGFGAALVAAGKALSPFRGAAMLLLGDATTTGGMGGLGGSISGNKPTEDFGAPGNPMSPTGANVDSPGCGGDNTTEGAAAAGGVGAGDSSTGAVVTGFIGALVGVTGTSDGAKGA
jgi:hypothetical protein